jgi:hypothetical protein
MDDQQWNSLVAASDAVEATPAGAAKDAAREARNALIIATYRAIMEAHPGVYPNRWGPQAVSRIAEATGLHRAQVSRIVNNTPVVRGRRVPAELTDSTDKD